MPKGDDTNLWVHLPVAVMVNYIIFVELFTYTGTWYYNYKQHCEMVFCILNICRYLWKPWISVLRMSVNWT